MSDFRLKQTEHFKRRVLVQRPYLRMEWCLRAVRNPTSLEVQPDGRIRLWIYVNELGKYLRVVTLEDGETIHTAFPDRNFKPR